MAAAMSDNILSIIPADPGWQPTSEAADAAMAVLRRLVPQLDGFVTTEYRTTWHERVAAVDCGANLERIECPACQNGIDVEWWADLLAERFGIGFTNLAVTVPGCGAEVSLHDLRHDCPFAGGRMLPAQPPACGSSMDPVPDTAGDTSVTSYSRR